MRISRFLWGDSARIAWLLAAATALMTVMLGTRELWTHEQRWAVIGLEMMRSGDYLHPLLFDEAYYDKPVGSYWLMIALARVLGGLHEWALRLPSVLAGLLAVWCTVRLGTKLFDRRTGMLAGWMLATTFFFVFWARVASSDMLNLAGTIAAVAWYFERKEKPGLLTYVVFGLICGATALMKGLIGPAVVLLVLLPDLLRNREWKRHLNWSIAPSAIPGLILYILPFVLAGSNATGPKQESGFWMVLRENVIRYFSPFDHNDPPWIYFRDLPLFTLPWAFFIPSAIVRIARTWKERSGSSRWCTWAVLLIFLFLTASGSRRNYYILPIVPFATLFVADWLAAAGWESRRQAAAGWITAISAAGMALFFGLAMPWVDNAKSFQTLAAELRTAGADVDGDILLVDAPMKTAFYIAPRAKAYRINSDEPDRILTFLIMHPRALVFGIEKFRPAVESLLPGRTKVRQRLVPPPFRWIPVPEKPGDEVVAYLPAR